jgi:hypothetical protein
LSYLVLSLLLGVIVLKDADIMLFYAAFLSKLSL